MGIKQGRGARVVVGNGPHWGEVVHSCREVDGVPACMAAGQMWWFCS